MKTKPNSDTKKRLRGQTASFCIYDELAFVEEEPSNIANIKDLVGASISFSTKLK